MSAIIIDGKKIAEEIKDIVKLNIDAIKEENLHPVLSVILVGDDQASKVYVKQKEKACKEIGITSRIIELPYTCKQEELEETIKSQVNDLEVVGILVQLPLPPHLNTKAALKLIPSYKDVDGFSNVNVGKLWTDNHPTHTACTPMGVMHILDEINNDLSGKHVVIVGRSNTVGKPLAALCLQRNATVTICHSKTNNLGEITKQADVLIVAVGKPKLITADMVKQDAIVIDVGINRVDGKLCGDVDFDNVKEIASYITPVPGGVGPLTIAKLMENTMHAAWKQRSLLYFSKKEREESV